MYHKVNKKHNWSGSSARTSRIVQKGRKGRNAGPLSQPGTCAHETPPADVIGRTPAPGRSRSAKIGLVPGRIGEAISGAGSAGPGREGARGCAASAQWSGRWSGAARDLQGVCLFRGSRGVPLAASPIRGGTFLNGSCSMKMPFFTSGPGRDSMPSD